MKAQLGLVVILLCCWGQLSAQNGFSPKQREAMEQLMEKLTENSEEGIDYSDLQTRLEYLMLNPLNLNSCNAYDLEALFFLTPVQQHALIMHRLKYGAYLSIYELQAVEGIDTQTARMLALFVRIDETTAADHERVAAMLQKGKHELIYTHNQELQKRKGYLVEPGKGYAGSPYQETVRYRFAYNKRLAFGYAGKKDKGEQQVFDFNTLYFFYHGKGRIKDIALGDYQANFGYGLIFGSGMGVHKSAMVLNTGNIYETLRAYRSVNEAGFLRGAAVTVAHKHAALTVFVSSKKVSATLGYDSAGDGATINSIALSGLHRTVTELARRNNSTQQLAGLNLCYKSSTYKLGMCWVGSTYSYLMSSKTKAYQLYDNRPAVLQNAGVYAQVYVKNVSVYGELAGSSNKGLAGYAGMLVPLHPRADLLMFYRHYGVSYQGIQANAFSEYGDCRNEEGLYTALQFKPANQVQVGMYADVFKSAWLRYLANAPGKGREYLVNVQYSASKTMVFEVRYKCELKVHNVSNDDVKLYEVEPWKRQQLRLQFNYQLSKELGFKTRFEEIFFDKSLQKQQSGSLFFEDVHAKLFGARLGLTARLAWFDVQDYNARVYATENDVLYMYSIPQFQNKGWRFYLLMHYRINKMFELNMKYGKTTYSNVRTIGSGLDEIDGNALDELRVQLRVVW